MRTRPMAKLTMAITFALAMLVSTLALTSSEASAQEIDEIYESWRRVDESASCPDGFTDRGVVPPSYPAITDRWCEPDNSVPVQTLSMCKRIARELNFTYAWSPTDKFCIFGGVPPQTGCPAPWVPHPSFRTVAPDGTVGETNNNPICAIHWKLQRTCNGQVVTIDMNLNGGNGTGTNGPDVILGTPGADSINARGGDDLVCADSGNDTVSGGNGNDTVYGNGGKDTIDGGNDKDRLYGNDGKDTITGGAGKDKVWGGNGDDTLSGGDKKDKIWGGGGNDRINGDGGNDLLWGNNGDDKLFGNGGRDTLSGGGGSADVCKGNQGSNDTADATCETVAGVP